MKFNGVRIEGIEGVLVFRGGWYGKYRGCVGKRPERSKKSVKGRYYGSTKEKCCNTNGRRRRDANER